MSKTIIFILTVLTLLLVGCNEFSDIPEPDVQLSPPIINDFPEQEEEFASYRYIKLKDGVEITRFLWTDEEEVVIPEQIDQLPVVSIGDSSFYQSFEKFLILPESVETINDSAFYRCYYLEEISLGSNIVYMGNNPFFRCSSLKTINVSPENRYFLSLDGVLYNKDQTVLLVYPEGKEDSDYVIPDSVTEIDGMAFGYHTKLKNIYIPATVQKMPEYNIFIYPDDIVPDILPQ